MLLTDRQAERVTMLRKRIAGLRRFAMAAPLVAACVLTVPGVASATPPSGSYIDHVDRINDRQIQIHVYAASMNKDVPIDVILPADQSKPRPIFYLLNGAGGGEDGATWAKNTDLVDFFKDKNVNVVVPASGKWSYYTDWERDDPKLGRNKWATFLADELPPLLNAELNSDGTQAIAGISSSATSVLNLAIENPGFYKSASAYSGCVQSSDPFGQAAIRITEETWGGVASIENMWGPLNGPGWREHDPLVNAEKLRGTQIYMSTGTGIPSFPNDSYANPRIQDGRAALFDQLIVGGPIEAATNYCTANMARRLGELNIPAVVDFRPTGTHSWGYWQDDLHKSWPFIAASLGV